MLNWSTVMTAISAFGILASVLFQFFNVHPSEKRYVTIKTMRVILVVLFLFSLYMTIQGGGSGGGGLVNGPATAEPTVSLPDPTPSPTPEPSLTPEPTPEPSPTPDVQTAAPTQSVPPPAPTERPTPAPPPETAAPAPPPTAAPRDTFLLEAFDDKPYTPDNYHFEYCGPNDGEFILERFPMDLPLVPGYYYVKIHRDSTCQDLALASFYVDSSVVGYAIGFRRTLSWGEYDVGEVDEDCLLCSWGYRAVPNANLRLTLVDGRQFSARGLEIRIFCEEFGRDVFSCAYQGEPIWLSLPPGYDYGITVCFDSFTAAEGSLRVTAPQDASAPETFQHQLA